MPVSSDESYVSGMLHFQDRETFSCLYDRYSAAVFGEILRFVKRRDVAEELLKEVFIAIWKNSNQYDAGKNRIFTWILSITRTICIDHLSITDKQPGNETDHVNVLKGFQQSF